MSDRKKLRELTVGAKRPVRVEIVEFVNDNGRLRKPRAAAPLLRADGSRAEVLGDALTVDPDAALERVSFEVRAPTIKQRNNASRSAGYSGDDKAARDPLKFQLLTMIENTYVPGTQARVFELADLASLEAEAPGSYVDVLGQRAVAMMAVDVEDAAEKSAATAS